MRDKELAARLGCWLGAVFNRRVRLGVAAFSPQGRRYHEREPR